MNLERWDGESLARAIELLRHTLGYHTLGYPNDHRNYFVTDEGHADTELLERMADEGLMTKHRRAYVPGITYVATKQGKALLERFCPSQEVEPK